MLITHVKACMQVWWTKGCQLCYQDHIVNFQQDITEIATKLSYLPEDTNVVIIQKHELTYWFYGLTRESQSHTAIQDYAWPRLCWFNHWRRSLRTAPRMRLSSSSASLLLWRLTGWQWGCNASGSGCCLWRGWWPQWQWWQSICRRINWYRKSRASRSWSTLSRSCCSGQWQKVWTDNCKTWVKMILKQNDYSFEDSCTSDGLEPP